MIKKNLFNRSFIQIISLVAVLIFFLIVSYLVLVDRKPKSQFRISASRPLGSECGLQDSVIPKMSSGGSWGGPAHYDPTRTMNAKKNKFGWFTINSIIGYVSFSQKGTLQIRSYDDLNGEVYCGWSSAKINFELSGNQSEKKFIRFHTCMVGDGDHGGDQVHEICWFPEGAANGQIIYSSAHDPRKSTKQELSNAEMYIEKDLQDLGLAVMIIPALTREYKLKKAKFILDQTIGKFKSGSTAKDLEVGQQTFEHRMLPEDWLAVLQNQLAFSIMEGSIELSKKILAEVETFLREKEALNCYDCNRYKSNLPLYRWLLDYGKGKRFAQNHLLIEEPEERVNGDVYGVTQFLLKKTLQSDFLKFGEINGYFWVGLSCYLEKDFECAKVQLSKFINENDNFGNPWRFPFEFPLACMLMNELK